MDRAHVIQLARGTEYVVPKSTMRQSCLHSEHGEPCNSCHRFPLCRMTIEPNLRYRRRNYHEFRINRKIRDLKLNSFVGSGLYGDVYLTNTGTALKITAHECEKRTAIRVQELGIKEYAKIYRVWTEGDYYFIEREYIPFPAAKHDIDRITGALKEIGMIDVQERNAGTRVDGSVAVFDGMIR